jgi:hypothetical protein
MVRWIGKGREMLNVKSKRAIAMIELIFSLVIMGIVLLSTPMLIQQSIRSGNVALQQEAIAAAATQTGVILSANWDEKNTKLGPGSSPILNTNRVVIPDLLNFNGGNLPGLRDVSGRVSLVSGAPLTPSTILGPDINLTSADNNESDFTTYDDVDDYHNSTLGTTTYSTQNSSADTGDYVDVNLSMQTTISYVEDRPAGLPAVLNNTTINMGGALQTPIAVPTNIKMIQVHLTSNSGIDELNKSIILHAFSCNIGTFQPQGAMKP